jgi:pentose-5-phosphate-3-epimerase
MEIIPAIMPKGFADIGEHAEKVFNFVDTIQLDIMDGQFVEAKSWPFFDKDKQSARELMDGEIRLPFSDKIKYEFDLMVRAPENDLKKYVKLGASRLIIHANSIDNRELFLEEVEIHHTIYYAENFHDCGRRYLRYRWLDKLRALQAPDREGCAG